MPAETVAGFAAAVGAHALAVFLALLVVVLLLVAAGGWLLRSHLLPQAQSRLGPLALVLMSAAIGFALVLGAASLFAEIAEHLGSGAAMSLADEALTAAIRAHVAPATLAVFAVLTHFGDPITLTLLGTVVALLLWWQRRRALALGWVIALGGNALLNPALKRVFERVRPVHEVGLINELGWSFPSGHTSGATVAYGMLAYVAMRTLPQPWHAPLVLAATALAFTVGCSRVFLQVHFASDVLAGFASGAAWLTVCIVSVELARVYRRRA
ncbi:MAG: phosphatase PAP2 family protein [Burkholderiales bacterium]|nr:phosphatase PAP2 family protein [Burkholderiales bacterium]